MNSQIAFGGIAVLGWTLQAIAAPLQPSAEAATPQQRIAALSVPFVPNAGQWDDQAAFGAQTFAGTLFVTTEGALVYSLPGKRLDAPTATQASTTRPRLARQRRDSEERSAGWVLKETFIDGGHRAITVTPRGNHPAAAKVGYFNGRHDAVPQRNLDTFGRINLGDVFPGINVQLRATGSNVEKIFTVAPWQDPSQIRLQVNGATRLELGAGGELIAHTGNGALVYTAPIAFQDDSDGTRQSVAVRYALDAAGDRYGFLLAGYDTARPLVIDPLLQSTYLGSANTDLIAAIAFHPLNGDVYVAGFTTAVTTTFPKTTGGAQNNSGGVQDAFVSRFTADLTALVQSSYLGGAGTDSAASLAIHPVSGDIYLAGRTNAPASTFPGVSGSAQPTFGGGTSDAFVSRFSADLATLHRSSYLGGMGNDLAAAIAIHPVNGDIYVTGLTDSSVLPGLAGAAQIANGGGGSDAFVTRFSTDLVTLRRSTFLGAAGDEIGSTLAIHPLTGEVYVAGQTSSPVSTFPGVSGSAQSVSGGAQDVFITRFSADLGTRLRSTYLGAAGDDRAHAIAIHPVNGDIYVTGFTGSLTNTFPGVTGGAQGSTGGSNEGFISRLNSELTLLLRSTYIGAAGSDVPEAIAIHPVTGEVYVAGITTSLAASFPGVAGGAQGAFGGGFNDSFVSRHSADLMTRIQSTYLGAGGSDEVHAIAIHPLTGEVYVAGLTDSPGTTFPGVSGGAQGTSGGGNEAFLSRFSLDLQAPDVVPNAFAFTAQAGVPLNVMRTSVPVQISGLGSLATVSVSGALGSAFCVSTGNNCSCDATAGAAFTTTPGTIANNQYVCARHVSSGIVNDLHATTIVVGGGAAKFVTTTGNLIGGNCSLDVDGNGTLDALTDGLMLIRALFGLTGTAVTNAAVGSGATRSIWAQIQPYLNGNCGTTFAP